MILCDVVNPFRINGSRINYYILIELPCIVCQVGIACAYFITPLADGRDLMVPFNRGRHFVLFGSVGDPDGIVKVIDDLFSQYFGYNPLEDRWTNRCYLPMDEDVIVFVNSEEQQKPSDKAFHYAYSLLNCLAREI